MNKDVELLFVVCCLCPCQSYDMTAYTHLTHAEYSVCAVRGTVGPGVDCMSEGSDSLQYLATSLHVPEKRHTCDFIKAEGSYYPQ